MKATTAAAQRESAAAQREAAAAEREAAAAQREAALARDAMEATTAAAQQAIVAI